MGRALITLAILCGIAVYLAGKPNEAPSTFKQATTDQGVVGFTPRNNLEGNTQTQTTKNESPRPYASAEWMLVYVGILTLIALAYQANEMRKATEAMQGNTEIVRRQADLMEQQTVLSHRPKIIVRN